MLLQVGVKAFLKNEEGMYLILERNLDKYPDMKNSNLWDIPGGRIEPGISLFENLKREIFEETQLELKAVPAPKLIDAQDILRPEKHVVRLTFVAEISGEPSLSDEHTSYKWISKQELDAMDNLDSFAKDSKNKL